MTHVPRVVCVPCNRAMRPAKNGETVASMLSSGEVYFKADVDRWRCPQCGHEVWSGFGRPVMRWEPRFATTFADNFFND